MIRSTFAGLEIGRTGLTVSQIGLDVTSHNIANVDTIGYTRQRMISTAYDPWATIGKALPVTQANVGNGVRVKILDQIRSAYLDRRFRTENTINSYWMKRTEGLTYLESFFDNVNEETSINYSIANFFKAVKVLSEDTVESAQRTLLKTAGMDLVQQINSIYTGLIDLQDTQDQAVKVLVEDINRIAKEITELNKSIYGYELSGLIANDLRDKRNLLIDELSTLVDVEYNEFSDGMGNSMLEVKIGGNILVRHDKYNELDVEKVPNKIDGEADVWAPVWKPQIVPGPDITNVFLTDLAYTPIELTVKSADEVKMWIAQMNHIAAEFNKLYVQVEEMPPTSGEWVLTPAAFAPPEQAAEDMKKAQQMLDTLKKLVVSPDAISFDCQRGGEHAVITIGGVIFARSAGCLDSDIPTPIVSYIQDPPEKKSLGAVDITGGELKAYLDMRDGDGVNNSPKGIPYYVEMLNNLVRAIVQEVNAIHYQGWTDDLIELSRTGVKFFDDLGAELLTPVYEDPTDTTSPITGYTYSLDPAKLKDITAKNFALSEDVMRSVYNIACSSVQVVRGKDGGDKVTLQSGNNENMNILYKLFEKKDIVLGDLASGGVSIGSLDGYTTTIRFDVGNTLNFAKKTADNSTVLALAAENQRISVSGVSLDEEMINMVKYQHAYNGAARVITVMDELLDKLINGTGRVGL